MNTMDEVNRRRRGATAVLVCISLPLIAGFAALTIDIGFIAVSLSEMQAAADSAALAGAIGAPLGTTATTTRAIATGSSNSVAGQAISASELTIRTGYWDSATGTFTDVVGGEAAAPNAAHVTGARPEVHLFFARIFGRNSTHISRSATAIFGGGVCAGMWGLDGVDAQGSITTDSYDSTAGPYGPGNTYLNGDLCSNAGVDIDGNVSIGGDIMYGVGYDLTTSGSSYTIFGAIGEHANPVDVPTIDMATAAIVNDNATIGLTTKNNDPFGGTQWDFVVTGNDSLTIPPGTYYMTSATVDGQATITVTGPTVFYIDGPATFSGGGLLNVTQDPTNLIIYSTGATLNIDGGGAFYGGVVAPTTTVTFTGGSDIYGTIMAGTLIMTGNTAVHVDSDLVSILFGVGPEAPVLVE